jgi:mannobiose 2-epimerase
MNATPATKPIRNELVPAVGTALAMQMREHLFGHILPFWCGPAVDHEHGGWMAWLANDLKYDRSQPKGVIVHSRILWAFSASHRASPQPQLAAMARRACDFLLGNFWDEQHGGLFWRLNDRAELLDDSKKTYGQAFGIYALTEFYQAFGDPLALQRAKELFELIERHAHDTKFGGYYEVCRRDWSLAGPEARLSDKDQAEKKSMNNHLHVLEAYTSLHRVWPDALVAARLRELLGIFLTKIIDLNTGHLHHFFDEQWNVRSDTYTFGHDIEASWLLCEGAEELGKAKLVQAFKPTVIQMAEKVLAEAMAEDGAIFYEGKDGHVIDQGKECWPQAEAVVGFLNAYQLSRDEKFLHAASRVWSFIETKLADHIHGEWFWKINSDGTPDPTLPKVSEWKGPYHGTRACLEAMRRLGTNL